MSDKVNLNTNPQVFNTEPQNVNSDNKSQLPPGFDDLSDEAAQLPPAEELVTNKKISLEGAEATKDVYLPKGAQAAINNIRIPRATDGFGRMLARAFLAVVNFFKGNLGKSSATLSEQAYAEKAQYLPVLNDAVNKGHPFKMTNEMLGNLSGLGKTTHVEAFSNDENDSLGNILFNGGNPKLSDIKQDPALQDCWFLSSITSALHSHGPDVITRLFSESPNKGFVTVHLGEAEYEVPLGRLTNDSGNKFGSNSANWVVVLENAMMMHMATAAKLDENSNLNNAQSKITMNTNEVTLGLEAIYGGVHRSGGDVASPVPGFNLDTLKQMLSAHMPVVIGHTSYSQALTDNVAPHHAVTVLEVVDNKVRVLDPYGVVKDISASSLQNYKITSLNQDFAKKTQNESVVNANENNAVSGSENNSSGFSPDFKSQLSDKLKNGPLH